MYWNKVKNFKLQNTWRPSRALDICRLSWMQYSPFCFGIRSILTKSTIVQYLSVQDLIFLSDHWPILLKLTRNYNFLPNKTIKDTQVCELKHKPTRYTWKSSLGKAFALRLSLERNKISNVPLSNESDTNFRSKSNTHWGKYKMHS